MIYGIVTEWKPGLAVWRDGFQSDVEVCRDGLPRCVGPVSADGGAMAVYGPYVAEGEKSDEEGGKDAHCG